MENKEALINSVVCDFQNGKTIIDISKNYKIGTERVRRILLKEIGENSYVEIKNKNRENRLGHSMEFKAISVLAKKLGRIPIRQEAIKIVNLTIGNTLFSKRYKTYVALLTKKGYKTKKEKGKHSKLAKSEIIKNQKSSSDNRIKEIISDFENGNPFSEISQKYCLKQRQIRHVLFKKFGSSYMQIKKNIANKRYYDAEFKEISSLAEKLDRIPRRKEANEVVKSSLGGEFPNRYSEYVKLLKDKGFKTHKEKKLQQIINQLILFTIDKNRLPSSHEIQNVLKIDYKTYNIGSNINEIHDTIKKEMKNRKC